MELAVLDARGEADDILAVKLLRDPRECRAQVVGVLQLEIPAAGFLGEGLEPAVRTAPHLSQTVEVVALAVDV